jgi:tetratricopeptide (TPR) repeat protein
VADSHCRSARTTAPAAGRAAAVLLLAAALVHAQPDPGSNAPAASAPPRSAGEKELTLPASATNQSVALARYGEGVQAESAGQIERAIACFEAAAAADSNLTEVSLRLTETYKRRGDFTNAARHHARVVARHPGDLPRREVLAFLQALAGDFAAARTTARHVITSHPHNISVQATLFEIDRTYLGTTGAVLAARARVGDPALQASWWTRLGETLARLFTENTPIDANAVGVRSLALFEEALRLQPGDHATRIRVADLQLLCGRFAEAIAHYERVLASDASRPDLLTRLALARAGMRDGPGAIRDLQAAIAQRPGAATPQFLVLAEMLYASGDRTNAAVALEAAATAGADPLACAAHALRSRPPDLPTARTLLQRAVTRSPDNAAAAIELGNVLILLKQFDAASNVLAQAAARLDGSVEVPMAAAAAAAQAGRHDEALAWITTAETRAGSSTNALLRAELLFQRAAVTERAGDPQAAEKLLRDSLALRPDDARALNYLAFSFADRGVQLDEARVLIDKALIHEPLSAAYIDTLAWVLFRTGRHDEALRKLLDALAIEPDEPEILDHLGQVYLALGHEQLALDAWNRSLRGDPARESSRRQRDELLRRYEPGSAAP